jgi:hypothetical protein
MLPAPIPPSGTPWEDVTECLENGSMKANLPLAASSLQRNHNRMPTGAYRNKSKSQKHSFDNPIKHPTEF